MKSTMMNYLGSFSISKNEGCMSEKENELSSVRTIESNPVGNVYPLDDTWEKTWNLRERFMNSFQWNDLEVLNLKGIDEEYHGSEEIKAKEKALWQTISFSWMQLWKCLPWQLFLTILSHAVLESDESWHAQNIHVYISIMYSMICYSAQIVSHPWTELRSIICPRLRCLAREEYSHSFLRSRFLNSICHPSNVYIFLEL